MKIRYLLPLLGFLAPTLIIGFGWVIPGSPIEGWNQYTVGFVATVAGAGLTYVSGLVMVLRDRSSCSIPPSSG